MRNSIEQSFFAAVMVALLGWGASANATLTVINGDFTDLTGLTPTGGEWYHGVPAGWTSTGPTSYTVNTTNNYGNPNPPVVNIDGLGNLKQNVGTTVKDPVVTLTFDVGTFNSTPSVTARITDGTTILATATYGAGTRHTLKAIVPVGSPIQIEFYKNTGSGSPWIDNVSVAEGTDANLINNGTFSNGLTGWTQASWAGGSFFGTNANGPANTNTVSGNYAYAGGGNYNLLQQRITGVTNGGAYRLTFRAGSKAGQGAAYALLSLYDGLAGSYNNASFDYRPSDASFGSYTVDFVARGPTDLWLRSDGGTYADYADIFVTPIANVGYALNYSNSAAGYTEITTALSGSGKLAVTTAAANAGLTLWAANTYSGGTEITGGRLYVVGNGTLGDAAGAVTVSDAILDLRNQQTRTGAITITNNGFIKSGDGTGSLVNNGGAFQFAGGSLEVPLSGSGGMNITGGGRITSSNSYTGATTISGTTGWYGTHAFYLENAGALGAASSDLTISGGTFGLQNNTLTRSGVITITDGTINTGTISKSGANYDLRGGVINAVLAGTAGLTKSGAGNAALYGTNTYGGDTVINGGALVVGSAEGLGAAAGAVTVNSGANLYVGAGLTVARTGNLTINGGSLTTDNTNLATISLSGGGNFMASNAATLALKLAGTGGLTVGGTGTTYLWAANSYTGPTVVNSGELRLGGNGSIAESSTVQISLGASVNLTGEYAPNNINRTIAGLTGGGILYGSGGTVTVDKASGTDTFSGEIQGGQGLIKSGAGSLVLTGPNSYSGTTTVSGGSLVVSNNVLAATILPGSVTVAFASVPTPGTYSVLSGSLDSASLATISVTGLGSGKTATLANSPNLVVQVSDAASGPTFGDAFPGGVSMTDVAPNGLTYLMNYAFGGSATNPANLPSQVTSDPSNLTLVAYVRTNNASGTLTVKGEKGNSLDAWDTNNPISGTVAPDQSGAPAGTQKQIFSVPNSGDRLFLRLKATLQP